MSGEGLRAKAAEKRAEADAVAAGAGVADVAATRLSGRTLAGVTRRTDAALRRYVEADAEARTLEHRAALAEAREREASRPRLTRSDVEGAALVRDAFGWHRVVRVNRTSVTVATAYSWTDRIPLDKIHDVRRAS